MCCSSFGSKKGLGQNCSYVLEMYHQLAYPQTATQSAQLSGDLNSVTFNLYFEGTGLSYPADMMVYLYAPNGQCIVWGGWDVIPTGTCQMSGQVLPILAWQLEHNGQWQLHLHLEHR